MSKLDELETKFGRFAVPGITRIVVGFNALVFILLQINPAYAHALTLDPDRVMAGEVWRLFTYLFIPSTSSFFWIFFALGFLWFVGEGLERAWGSFKLNLYYLCGMAGCTAAAFIFGGGASANVFLNLSLFFAFATVFPDEIIYVLFILPMRMKWLALISLAWVVLLFFGSGLGTKMTIAVSLVNYALFFGPMAVRNLQHRHSVADRRREFARKSLPEDEPLHQCAHCKRTELSDPDLDFRVSRDGQEYCSSHLPGRQA